jgi:hypothetical protein
MSALVVGGDGEGLLVDRNGTGGVAAPADAVTQSVRVSLEITHDTLVSVWTIVDVDRAPEAAGQWAAEQTPDHIGASRTIPGRGCRRTAHRLPNLSRHT